MTQWFRTVLLCNVCVAAGSLHAQVSISAALAAGTHASVRTTASESSGLPTPPATLEDALHEAFRDADIVFTGEVAAIEREPGCVVVRWRVDEGVRGVASGTIYGQREWSGLWSGGTARYVVGEQALVLLHAPSVAGYTSPAGGLDGIIPLRGNKASGTVDLRWIAQHVAVTDQPRLRPMLALRAAGGSITASTALQEAAARIAAQARTPQGKSIAPEPPVSTGIKHPVSQPGTDVNARVDSAIVLAMIRAWQRSAGTAQ